MKAKVVWTPGLDGRLRALRMSGLTWDGIAAEMKMGRNTVLERARKIGARARRPVALAVVAEAADRPARPSGHPQCWALLIGGTVLEGSPYPFPVFL